MVEPPAFLRLRLVLRENFPLTSLRLFSRPSLHGVIVLPFDQRVAGLGVGAGIDLAVHGQLCTFSLVSVEPAPDATGTSSKFWRWPTRRHVRRAQLVLRHRRHRRTCAVFQRPERPAAAWPAAGVFDVATRLHLGLCLPSWGNQVVAFAS